MSRSDPPRSSIVARLRQNSSPILPSSAHAHSIRRKLSIRFAKLMRWLHIYLSMFGLAAVSVFQRDRNHAQSPRLGLRPGRAQARGRGPGGRQVDRPRACDDSSKLARGREARSRRTPAEVARDPRGASRIFGSMTPNARCRSRARPTRPTRSLTARSGHYTLTELDHGLIALINDLHKGRDTGSGLVGGDRSLGRADDADLADRSGLALLSQAQARAGRRGRPRRHRRPRCDLSVLGAVGQARCCDVRL